MMVDRSSCVIREVSLPRREYRVAPPERWEETVRTGRRPVMRRRQRRRVRILPGLLALALAFGFLLGRASAQVRPGSVLSMAQGLLMAEEAWPDAALVEPAYGEDAVPEPSGGGDAMPEPSGGEEIPVSLLPRGPETEAEDPIPQAEDWNLILINAAHALSQDYQPPQLTQMANGHAIDSRAYPALQEMMDAARAAGVEPTICSSFRTWETQERLYQNKVARLKSSGWDPETVEQEAARWVARPGTSEHQVGLAVDIVDRSYQVLDHKQETTAAQKWLMAHCAEYGFILRYPSEKGEITGIGYEPWHYRYVGREAAQAITAQGVCLEEYIAGLAANP